MSDIYDDMPPLVDSNPNMPQPRIPPPVDAAFMAGHTPAQNGFIGQGWNAPPPQNGFTGQGWNAPPPQNAFPGQGWNAPLPENAFAGQGWNAPMPQPYPPFQPAAQEEWARWAQYWQAQVAPAPPSVPSPYVPHQPMNPETAQHGLPRRSNSFSAPGPSNTQQQAAAWNVWGPLMFPNHARPPIQTFPSTSSHTPASAVSTTRSLPAAYVPPDWPGERPKSWRRGFKFKSGISSLLFRSKTVSRTPDPSTDSARLNLAPVLQYDRALILDLRRSQHLLMIPALGRPVVANDLMKPSTNPPTLFMRLYHTRLPWYIDVVPMGSGSYVTLGDLFMTICQFLAGPIRNEDYYNDELDIEDKEQLRLAWESRCNNKKERMEGVKRVDFLREKYMFLGLTRGKNGMWQLRTGKGDP
ncbi:hypothetical protein DFJ58DRAFT_730063 [Suillus subalutaceus]|uniref:uncharacterized protein n=1 Tax=Suillus subalutaceus TaxID=48586 RepID=UPI001B8857FA|nr:uncharacterized protein DFJ58DRAFT_730063 [Suillus subalutaceus]KAG1847650.1 hypothetical protein DFJ58DRAFT_730063 [Suillus subalutaceus]